MLTRKRKSLQDIIDVLKFFHDNIAEEDDLPQMEDGGDASLPRRQILMGLIGFLESC